jgi:indolepyruvate ferredoxin oxidoreductase beta subunit
VGEENFDMLLAGVGGQGILFAGQVLLESALSEGHSVFAFEEHGMARRGGAVASHIRFGEGVYTPLIPVGFGKLLVAFEPAEALRHLHFMNSDSQSILNSQPVIPVSVSSGKGTYPTINEILDLVGEQSKMVYAFDATSLAKEAGNPITMNVVMLGGISASGATGISKETFLKIIGKRSPSRSKEINLKAFELGYKEVEEGR